MKKKTAYTELQCQNFIERGYDIIIRQNHEHKGISGPTIYYGMTHEVKVWPSVRYVSTGILLENLTTNWTVQKPEIGRDNEVILFCNPRSLQTLTVGETTISLKDYNRDQVLDFLRKKGIKFEDPTQKR